MALEQHSGFKSKNSSGKVTIKVDPETGNIYISGEIITNATDDELA